MKRLFQATLEAPVTRAASYSQAPKDLRLSECEDLIITLDIESAERDSTDETYDIYVVTSDGKSSWDLVHFPQVATTGAKRFTARISKRLLPQTVTTASPGVAAVEPAVLATGSGGSQAAKSLTAGSVRHGAWGNLIGHELVVAGTVTTGIKYSIHITGA